MPSNIRVYELARELGLTNKETLDLCVALGIGVKSHSSSVVEPQADRVRRKAEREGLVRDVQPEEPEAPAKKAAAKKTAAKKAPAKKAPAKKAAAKKTADEPDEAEAAVAPAEPEPAVVDVPVAEVETVAPAPESAPEPAPAPKPAAPKRRVTSLPVMVPTTRWTLRIGRLASTRAPRSIAGLHRSSSVVTSSDLSSPWSWSICR